MAQKFRSIDAYPCKIERLASLDASGDLADANQATTSVVISKCRAWVQSFSRLPAPDGPGSSVDLLWRLWAWGVDQQGRVEKLLTGELVLQVTRHPGFSSRNGHLLVMSPDSSFGADSPESFVTLRLVRASGCGCSSPLRGVDPKREAARDYASLLQGVS